MRSARTVVLLLAALAAAGCGRAVARTPPAPGVIVLGFDGMDPDLTRRLMDEGRMPAFSRLATMGTFSTLGTAVPPQSPVAWSDFITGSDAGTHGIFDFIHRDPATMAPFLSTTRTTPPQHYLHLGQWQVPLGGGHVELLRHGEAFWTVLEEHGVRTTVMRMPADFPPTGTATRELSGMGTPDLLGTYGTFLFFTTDPLAFLDAKVAGGEVVHVDEQGGAVKTSIHGPPNPFRRDGRPVSVDLAVYPDHSAGAAKIVVDGHELVLAVGEWSEWVPLDFELVPTQGLAAICRFYLEAVEPDLKLYVSPLNFDPRNPALPISTPPSFAGDLAHCTGLYYTQGMPEETAAVSAGVIDRTAFTAQARIAGEENIAQYLHLLDGYSGGLLFHYFGNTDLVSHIFWRTLDPGHPAYDPVHDPEFAHVIPDLYARMDEVVGITLDRMPPGTLLIVMSDHGFASWRRAFNLNTWLRDQGYLGVVNRGVSGWAYSNVDWPRTRAYGLGLNGLYVNLAGRERWGVVSPEDRRKLLDELEAKLLAVIDPETGEHAITEVCVSDRWYADGGEREIGPDIVVGYARGWRSSNASALGEIRPTEFEDNFDQWSGDHCMDHQSIPGILLTSRPLKRPATRLGNLAASILEEFGIEGFPALGDDGAGH